MKTRAFRSSRLSPLALAACLAAFATAGPLLAAPPAHAEEPARAWWHDAVFYEIFVRSFQDSGTDGIGDLKGVTSRLGEIQALGATALWLMPIFPSPSYHGYDTIDYRAINPDYGTMDDFRELVRQAHEREIKIVLDLAVNHTSDRAPWFGSREDWYLWSAHPVTPWVGLGRWHEQSSGHYYYSSFSANMPDLNWGNADVHGEVRAILRYWATLGVDGFRLDAARYYVKGPHGETDTPGTHAAIAEMSQELKSEFPDAMLVGEIWADAPTIAPYVNDGRELDLAFDFPLAFGLVKALQTESGAPFLKALRDVLASVKAPATLGTFLTNHDMIRAATQLKGDARKLKLAAHAILTLPGTPFLYYGEEIGLPNGDSNDDRDKRAPMMWDATPRFGFTAPDATPWHPFATQDPATNLASQRADSSSLYVTYQKLIARRRASAALSHGHFRLLDSSDPRVVAYALETGPEHPDRVEVILNFSSATVTSRVGPHGGRAVSASLAPFSAKIQALP